MKLYFYFLENGKLHYEECEAGEKQKSYTLINNKTRYYGGRILKSEIGFNFEYDWKQFAVLEKRDDEYAKKLLSEYINGEIDKLQKKVDAFKNQLKLVEEWRINQ